MDQIRSRISKVDGSLAAEAQKRLDNLTKPQGSLGRLEEFARRVVAITGDKMPVLDKKVVFTFAGDHGIANEGVSAYPKEVTPQMVLNFLRGGAGINVLARHAGADVVVVDIGVDYDFGDVPGLVSRKVVRGTANRSSSNSPSGTPVSTSDRASVNSSHGNTSRMTSSGRRIQWPVGSTCVSAVPKLPKDWTRLPLASYRVGA